MILVKPVHRLIFFITLFLSLTCLPALKQYGWDTQGFLEKTKGFQMPEGMHRLHKGMDMQPRAPETCSLLCLSPGGSLPDVTDQAATALEG